jgi:diaminopimelate decarboxylase/aspartate kinase
MGWVVVKFGGTSVANLHRWGNIHAVVSQKIKAGDSVLVVCSALSGVSNLLEQLLAQAPQRTHQLTLDNIVNKYRALAHELQLDFVSLLKEDTDSLCKIIEGIALLGEVSPRVHARVMAFGEVLLTKLGQAYLQKCGLDIAWQDVRQWLHVQHNPRQSEKANYLSAYSEPGPDSGFLDSLTSLSSNVVITQGFIASNEEGDTVLLGRGGSDTSAALLAAKITASSCEIWTDVPGIYTANPKHIPEARFIKRLDYAEAQEIASMGAKVLHPGSISPLRHFSIPLRIKYTPDPEREGTLISANSDEANTPIKSVLTKHGVVLISIETSSMWQQVGFMADVFQCFKQHQVSIDLVSTSEMSVTVSLDVNVNNIDKRVLSGLLKDLNAFARATVISPCASISLVGHHIRSVLHQLGDVFSVFEEQQIHLLSQAANDLNLTFVVNEDQAQRVAQKLHAILIEQGAASHYFNQSWQQEFGRFQAQAPMWWIEKREELLAKVTEKQSALYVYSQSCLRESVRNLQQCKSVNQIFYSMKANNNKQVLQTFYDAGIGFECVSMEEVSYLLALFPELDRNRVVFTPNFAPKYEYEQTLALGLHVTVDSIYPIMYWPDIFSGHELLLRIDPGHGKGHHKYVVTGGNESKFGIPIESLGAVAEQARKFNITISGLHSHAGSGILDPYVWKNTALFLSGLLDRFPDVKTLNLGGGLGIVEKPGQQALNLEEFNNSLQEVKQAFPELEIWIEPGRYLVARSGVLLARVTQVKRKGYVTFVGIETGMNSLIRPALYGSYHEIVNFTRLDEPKTETVNIVGPICESGDTLGYSRLLPETYEGDIVLIANVGAYGRCMSSHYNLREPAEECVVE